MFVFMRTNIMFWNCQCVRPKRKELELYLKENNFDMVAPNKKQIDFKIQGNYTIKSDRSTCARGGVALLIKHGLPINKEYRNIDLNIITDNEALVIDIDSRALTFLTIKTSLLTRLPRLAGLAS